MNIKNTAGAGALLVAAFSADGAEASGYCGGDYMASGNNVSATMRSMARATGNVNKHNVQVGDDCCVQYHNSTKGVTFSVTKKNKNNTLEFSQPVPHSESGDWCKNLGEGGISTTFTQEYKTHDRCDAEVGKVCKDEYVGGKAGEQPQLRN